MISNAADELAATIDSLISKAAIRGSVPLACSFDFGCNMATKPVKNETAEKASAMLRRIADMIDANDMGIANVGLVPRPPRLQRVTGMISPYQLSIDLEFFIISEKCAAFVDEIRG